MVRHRKECFLRIHYGVKRNKGKSWKVGSLVVLLLAGCGSNGPTRYNLSGRVTYGGQPIPAGRMVFEPDEATGNYGPVGTALIHNGHYQTKPGEGPVGGTHMVVIHGYDGIPHPVEPDETPFGMALFEPYRQSIDLPKESATRNFDVPNDS